MPGHRNRKLFIEDVGDATVVEFTDNKILDELNISLIREQLFSLVDELGRKKVILNFRNVEYLSSAALGTFITLSKKVNSAGGQLVLCNLCPEICEIFHITKLNKVFNIQTSPDEDDPDEYLGGVRSKLIPPKPSSGFKLLLFPPPAPEEENEP